MNSVEITQKWAMGTLERADVAYYIETNLMPLSEQLIPFEALEHVAMCCHQLYIWSHEGHALGHFLTAVVEDSLQRAVERADETNRRWLWLYPYFIYNCAPQGWRNPPKGWMPKEEKSEAQEDT